MSSPAHCKPLGKEPWQTGFTDFLLRGGEIVLCSQQFDEIVLDVINTISSAPVCVARLANAGRVDEIFLAMLNTNVLGVVAPDAVIAHKYHRHMRVAERTDGHPLIRITDDVAQTNEVCAPALTRVRQYSFKRFEIRMNVTENGEPHYDPGWTTEKSKRYNGSMRTHQRFGSRNEFCSRY